MQFSSSVHFASICISYFVFPYIQIIYHIDGRLVGNIGESQKTVGSRMYESKCPLRKAEGTTPYNGLYRRLLPIIVGRGDRGDWLGNLANIKVENNGAVAQAAQT